MGGVNVRDATSITIGMYRRAALVATDLRLRSTACGPRLGFLGNRNVGVAMPCGGWYLVTGEAGRLDVRSVDERVMRTVTDSTLAALERIRVSPVTGR